MKIKRSQIKQSGNHESSTSTNTIAKLKRAVPVSDFPSKRWIYGNYPVTRDIPFDCKLNCEFFHT